LEGNAFILDLILDIVEEVTTVKMREIRTSGGGAKSELVNQIVADTTQKIVKVVEESEPVIGSSIIALWAMNKKRDVSEIADRIVKIKKIFYPNENNKTVYERNKELLLKVMKKLSLVFK